MLTWLFCSGCIRLPKLRQPAKTSLDSWTKKRLEMCWSLQSGRTRILIKGSFWWSINPTTVRSMKCCLRVKRAILVPSNWARRNTGRERNLKNKINNHFLLCLIFVQIVGLIIPNGQSLLPLVRVPGVWRRPGIVLIVLPK